MTAQNAVLFLLQHLTFFQIYDPQLNLFFLSTPILSWFVHF